jgi:hypothetical protein
MADAAYQKRTLAAAAALALACLVLCVAALAGVPVPSWAGWLATGVTNAAIATEKWGLLRRGKP